METIEREELNRRSQKYYKPEAIRIIERFGAIKGFDGRYKMAIHITKDLGNYQIYGSRTFVKPEKALQEVEASCRRLFKHFGCWHYTFESAGVIPGNGIDAPK